MGSALITAEVTEVRRGRRSRRTGEPQESRGGVMYLAFCTPRREGTKDGGWREGEQILLRHVFVFLVALCEVGFHAEA